MEIIFIPILVLLIGLYLLVSGILIIVKDKNTKGKTKKTLVFLAVASDIVTDPVSSSGFRIMLGAVLIIGGLILYKKYLLVHNYVSKGFISLNRYESFFITKNVRKSAWIPEDVRNCFYNLSEQ